MMQARSLWACLVVASAAALGTNVGVRAEPLPKEACEAIGVEHAKLTEAGVPELVKKGPAWVKANLGDGRVQEVARYIKLQEELLFRCGHDKLRAQPGGEGDEAAGNPSTSGAPPLPQRKPPVPDIFKARVVPAAAGAEAARSVPPRVAPKPKRKPKVDDAYRPPPKAPAPQ